jgi:hypothetical protein
MQNIDRLPIILRNKSKAVSNYSAEKNEIRDLSLFENAKNFKSIKSLLKNTNIIMQRTEQKEE